MDLSDATIIKRDSRKQYTIRRTMKVSDRYNSGTQTVYMVDGKWLTEAEINRDYLIAGVDPQPNEHGW